jgi:hypothetical protein
MAVRLSAPRAGRPLPPGRFLIFISVRGWINPRAIVRLAGLSQLRNPVISSGIELAIFRLVAQCLNQLRYQSLGVYFYNIFFQCAWFNAEHFRIPFNDPKSIYVRRSRDFTNLPSPTHNRQLLQARSLELVWNGFLYWEHEPCKAARVCERKKESKNEKFVVRIWRQVFLWKSAE